MLAFALMAIVLELEQATLIAADDNAIIFVHVDAERTIVDHHFITIAERGGEAFVRIASQRQLRERNVVKKRLVGFVALSLGVRLVNVHAKHAAIVKCGAQLQTQQHVMDVVLDVGFDAVVCFNHRARLHRIFYITLFQISMSSVNHNKHWSEYSFEAYSIVTPRLLAK